MKKSSLYLVGIIILSLSLSTYAIISLNSIQVTNYSNQNIYISWVKDCRSGGADCGLKVPYHLDKGDTVNLGVFPLIPVGNWNLTVIATTAGAKYNWFDINVPYNDYDPSARTTCENYAPNEAKIYDTATIDGGVFVSEFYFLPPKSNGKVVSGVSLCPSP